MIGAARTAKGRAAEAKYNSSRHLVKKGDNLTKIAKSNNTTVGSIVKLNNIRVTLRRAISWQEITAILVHIACGPAKLFGITYPCWFSMRTRTKRVAIIFC